MNSIHVYEDICVSMYTCVCVYVYMYISKGKYNLDPCSKKIKFIKSKRSQDHPDLFLLS